MSWPDFWGTLLPPLAAALGTILTALAWTAVTYLKVVRDKYVESVDREALHSAVATGVRAEFELEPLATTKGMAAAVARHVLDKGAPEAAKAFDLSGGDLTRLVASKVSETRARKAAAETRSLQP